ncbi:multidrug ABC transporter ATP-binding protein [Sulfolobus sp. A20]|uniref:ABC transporter ATP-binding protein n=1 Tax=Sulfolobaceae TaxID=118883 RepID=UPI000845D47B|nr:MULTISPECIES: ABC transporter ATP-binding protein [unclassified Sulfolobus]TRM75804.1 ABC transporter ATP-binding protein [Sulfolobus sp. A20-N-F8]TRM78614.1 ABC transporter ATP-binding protein [Sulfolobus sp. B5]TRM83795.1 ABC transporter ATP-binding protein [Sulfolobus sp. A20-N-F6]TRM88184.1 ABC transporter ATP-binding protein [Sulfolobus sp. E3]TRM89698.1 ABC transporter ATP-binding protein [Sulfolobus sp. C3]TRM99838.1 ABC transporter ATP-binding protein [Sulfolobus sp. F1]
MSYIIEVNNLRKTYRKREVLRGITFKVRKGSITGFIGPNGSGKTTTIKILAGLTKEDSGEVKVFGQRPWDNPNVMEKLSVIFTNIIIPSENTVEEYLKDLSNIYGNDYHELIDLLDLRDYLKVKIKQLSSGLAQRVQLASSLLKDSELIIADEPTANLDPTSRIKFYEIVKKLNKEESITFFISSHILSELEKVLTDVVFINNGLIIYSGKMNEALDLSKEEEVYVLVNDVEKGIKVIGGVIDGPYIRVKGDIREIVNKLYDNGVEILSVWRSSLDETFKRFSDFKDDI